MEFFDYSLLTKKYKLNVYNYSSGIKYPYITQNQKYVIIIYYRNSKT